MEYKPSFNTDGFSEYLDKRHFPQKVRKDFFRRHFKAIDFTVLEEIIGLFSKENELNIHTKYPPIKIAGRLPDDAGIGTTIFSSTSTDILLCGYSSKEVSTLYSTLFHELIHANSYIFIDDRMGINHNGYVQSRNGHLYHVGLDEGMTDFLAGELFQKYCSRKNLPYLYEYSNLREILKLKRLIVFLSKKCKIPRKEIQKTLYSWYFHGINKDENGVGKSIYKTLTNPEGEFRLTDVEIIRILDDTLN